MVVKAIIGSCDECHTCITDFTVLVCMSGVGKCRAMGEILDLGLDNEVESLPFCFHPEIPQ